MSHCKYGQHLHILNHKLSKNPMLILHSTGKPSSYLVSQRYFWKTPSNINPSTSSKANKTVKTSENPLQYCMNLVKERDYEGFLQCLNFPTGGPQEAAIAVRAFNVEVAQTRGQIARNYSDVAGKFRLQFWKDTLRTIYGEEGAPSAVPRQPVAAMLQRFVGPPNGKVSKHHLHHLVEARQKTLQDRQFMTLEDLNAFSLHTQGGLLNSFLQIMDIATEDPSVIEAVHRLSNCLGILTQLRAVVPLAQSGIVLLPNDIMKKHDVKPVDLAKGSREPKVKNMCLEFGHIAERELSAARRLKKEIDRNSWIAFQATTTADNLLQIIKKSDGDLFSGRFQQRNPFLGLQLLSRRLRKTY